MKRNCEEIDVAAELQALYAACKGAGLTVEQIVHAACTAGEVQPSQLVKPVGVYDKMAWCLVVLCVVEGRCGRSADVARALGLKSCKFRTAVDKAYKYLAERPWRMVGSAIRELRNVIECGATKCEAVVMGREVFGLPSKGARSRLLSRELCRSVAEKIGRLKGDEGLFRGWRLVGQIWDSRPNARSSLVDKKMCYLVLLVAEGEGSRDSRIKGVMTVSREDEGMTLSNFYIEKEFRGHGWGRKMLDALLLRYRKDVDYVTPHLRLEVNTANEAACRLYRSVGFTDWTKTMELDFEE